MTAICDLCGELRDDCLWLQTNEAETGYRDEGILCYECRTADRRSEAKTEAEYWRSWKLAPGGKP